MLSSFFTYNDNYPATPWNEIDIEFLGRYSDDIQYNAITPGTTNHVGHRQLPYNPSHEFHTYAFEWTPTYVAWFIDGVESYRQTGSHIQTLQYAQKIMMNIWIPSAPNWAGQWNDAVLPVFAYYDYVSYASYTPGAGTVGTGNNFSPQWKDNFNSYDAARWDRATHTWSENQCDFVQENIVFKDSMMILCLTKDNALGYVDNVPPNVLAARAEPDGIVISYTEEVDSLSAVTVSNYIVQNNTVSSAKLFSDKKTVRLTIAAYDTSTVSSIILMNIKDRSVPQNTLTGKSVTIAKPQWLSFPLKINCGGPAFGSVLADQMWNPALEYGYLDGLQYQNNSNASGANDPIFFKSELNGVVEYRVRVPNGTYMVTLMMAENYFTAAGKRVFDLSVQGKTAGKDIDLFALVGKNVQYQRVVTNVVVTEGLLDIHCMPTIDNALLNGISILQLSTTGTHGNAQPVRSWKMGQNYPNPFNGSTRIQFYLPSDDQISVQIYNTLGSLVDEHRLGWLSSGDHSFTWNTAAAAQSAVASGVYYCVLKGMNIHATQKLVLVQ
jgi:hypothetical protein